MHSSTVGSVLSSANIPRRGAVVLSSLATQLNPASHVFYSRRPERRNHDVLYCIVLYCIVLYCIILTIHSSYMIQT
jgi:hypothetical protein